MLGNKDSLRLLASVSFGRVVFSQNALPTARPVRHFVDGGAVVVRTHLGPAARSVLGQVVAYQADAIDEQEHLGWSVIVTGYARIVDDPADAARYERLLPPWASGEPDRAIRIRPVLVAGYELVATTGPVPRRQRHVGGLDRPAPAGPGPASPAALERPRGTTVDRG
ncbi:hypothetical protein JOF53_008051 [Crossiella equi]|uniref:Pyridoxamine 5'-phosphate oxidase n=1 Tax=Crossiella equi TaxID=130796 RepID=A0ABS5ARI1_9PSEU|nr:pyridoxamine 5'-phosphate oxidase family protein [Crossiella equi]MBP2479179.1 hypothetical protein [Crossiella equi]